MRESRGFQFGRFRLDVERGALMCDGADIALRPKSFDVLHYLVRHPQRLVSRDELLKAAWPGVVVTDDSLTQCLIEIRKALGDDGRTIVCTVPRRGYRFELPVEPLAAASPGAADPGGVPETPPVQQSRPPSRWTLAALVVLAVALAATWFRAGPDSGGSTGVPADWQPVEASIAVLPFVDMSPHGDQEYLGDGIAEEILNLLAQVRGLTVIARTSSFSFREQHVDVGTIARRLNVAHVLEGSVRKSGDRVRVTAQLVDGTTGAHLWSETYDRQLDDIFATQDEIAQSVTEVLRAHLLGEKGTALTFGAALTHTPDPEAWDLYLRGRYLYGRRMTGDRVQAQRYFEQALDIDPEFAAAWVSLAAIYGVRAGDADLPEAERIDLDVALEQMLHALGRALELDPDNPEALLRMAQFEWLAGDMEQSLQRVNRALRQGRNQARFQSMLGGWAYALGDPVTGVKLQARAVALDPINAVHLGNYGQMLYSIGDLDEAAAVLDAASTFNPERSTYDQAVQANIAILRDDLAAASERAAALPPGLRSDQVHAMLAFATGDRVASDAALERIRQSADAEAPVLRAVVHAFRGEVEAVYPALYEAVERILATPDRSVGRHYVVELRSSPFLQPLHDDPRWQDWVNATDRALRRPGDEQILALLRDYASQEPGT